MAAHPDRLLESRLVERFRGGDAAALSTLFELHIDCAYSFALRFVRDRQDAEEAVSDTFLLAFRKIGTFRGDSSFRTWLFSILRNQCYSRLRQPRLFAVPPEHAEPDAIDPALHAAVRIALDQLPDRYREALVLCDIEQWDAAEAAQLMGMSPVATRSLLYRARRALRTRLMAEARETALADDPPSRRRPR